MDSPATTIVCDYSSEASLAETFTTHNIHSVICAFSLHHQSTSDAQTRLIRAADLSPCVKRFLPSEFNVDYDLPDAILPYPDKRYHRDARRALEQSATLEYSFVYAGMFMDYFGIPHVATPLRELGIFIDPAHGAAFVPEDGAAIMATTFTADVARYVALALDLEAWPRVMTTAPSSVSINELVRLTEIALGSKLRVTAWSIDAREDVAMLPRNMKLAKDFPERFPHGEEQVRALIGDLEASVALGAFDFGGLRDKLDLVDEFRDVIRPTRIKELLQAAWGTKINVSYVI